VNFLDRLSASWQWFDFNKNRATELLS